MTSKEQQRFWELAYLTAMKNPNLRPMDWARQADLALAEHNARYPSGDNAQ